MKQMTLNELKQRIRNRDVLFLKVPAKMERPPVVKIERRFFPGNSVEEDLTFVDQHYNSNTGHRMEAGFPVEGFPVEAFPSPHDPYLII